MKLPLYFAGFYRPPTGDVISRSCGSPREFYAQGNKQIGETPLFQLIRNKHPNC